MQRLGILYREEMQERERLKSEHVYDLYRSTLDKHDIGGVYDITNEMHSKILEMSNNLMMDKMMLDNEPIDLPYNLGNISIKKRKVRIVEGSDGSLETKMPVDWKATKQLWNEDEESKKSKQLVYHMNSHTGGYVYTWKWYRGISKITNIRLYKFYPLRRWKRLLASRLLNPACRLDFYEV